MTTSQSIAFHLAISLALALSGCRAGDPEPSGNAAGALTHPAAELHLEGLPNLRDLGGPVTTTGRRVKTGHVFRSQQLADAKDPSELSRLHLERVVDFRGSPEKAAAPDPSVFGAISIALPIFDADHPENDLGVQLGAKLGALAAAATDPTALEAARRDVDAWSATLRDQMIDSYDTFATDARATNEFRDFVKLVADGQSIIFHCVSGKDRTGFAAAILLRGLGVSWNDVLADYLRSNEALAAQNAAKIESIRQVWTDAPGHQQAGVLQTILGVDPAYLTASFDEIQDRYGGDHPPKDGEIASDEAIAAFYADAMGPGVQQAIQDALLE